eukprot:gene9837-12072_t
MLNYVSKRILIGILTLLAASVVVFIVLDVVPGDPARLMLGMNATEEAVRALQQQMGLDQPLLVRYASWIGGLLAGDFGKSYTYSVPVLNLITERIAVSLPLALISLFLSTIIAIPVGLFSASRRGTMADSGTMAIAQVGVAIPNFCEAEMCRLRGNEIGMVFQEPMTALNPVKTIGEQVAEGIRLHTGATRAIAEEQTRAILDRVGLPEILSEQTHPYTRQLAQASMHVPERTAHHLTLATPDGPLLAIRNLTRTYPGRRKGLFGRDPDFRAVDDVTFDIKPGQSTALVGRSGCGKSTLARMVLALDRPTDGQIHFAGRRIDKLTPDDLRPVRRNMQVVPSV